MSEHRAGSAGDLGTFMKRKDLKTIGGGVCAPEGFVAGALHAGIKRVASTKDDLALVLSAVPCTAAGTFTTNLVQAAPVLLSKKHLAFAGHRAVVLNSGNANACTGEQGYLDAVEMAARVGETFSVAATSVLVCSTGRIGVPMPMEKIAAGIGNLPRKLSRKGSRSAAVAIMTSDTHPKEAAREILVDGKKVRIGAIAKGAGMINPNMATMLCVITTDAALTRSAARSLLAEAVNDSFNRITIDGDTSTNDTVLLLANGMSGVRLDAAGKKLFAEALRDVCRTLAREIVRDGEGTTRIVDLRVQGAQTAQQARLAAEAVANSILLKCAWAGGDPNWGRILDALGYSGAVFDPARVDVFYDKLPLVRNGCVGPADPASVRKVAAKKEFSILVDLHAGRFAHEVISTDLTEEYVRLNLSE